MDSSGDGMVVARGRLSQEMDSAYGCRPQRLGFGGCGSLVEPAGADVANFEFSETSLGIDPRSSMALRSAAMSSSLSTTKSMSSGPTQWEDHKIGRFVCWLYN